MIGAGARETAHQMAEELEGKGKGERGRERERERE